MRRLTRSSAAFIFYTYAGYGALLWIVARLTRRRAAAPAAKPRVSVVIAAHNEAGSIGEALESILASDYPKDKLEVIVVSDGSTDGTDAVVEGVDGVRLIRQEPRAGQVPAFQAGAAQATGHVLLFADASELFQRDTVARLAAWFSDNRVGAVSGSKITLKTGTAVSGGDNLYTRYDAALRSLESRTGASWVGCEGGVYAIRKPLFVVDFPLSIAADNALCYRLYEKGYRHVFDASAVVLERPSKNLKNEFSRKVRIIVTQIRGMLVFRRLFNPLRHPLFVFQNASHKIFRWLVPFALVALFGSSAREKTRLGRAFFAAQALFYGLAGAGVAAKRRRAVPWFLSVPAYFVTVNAAGFAAWLRLFKDYSVWQPPARDTAVEPAREAQPTGRLP